VGALLSLVVLVGFSCEMVAGDRMLAAASQEDLLDPAAMIGVAARWLRRADVGEVRASDRRPEIDGLIIIVAVALGRRK
jgi:hypothetical protein